MSTGRSYACLITLALLLPVGTSAAKTAIWPTDSEWVEAALSSEDVDERREAALELGELPRASRERLLRIALLDDDVEVRASAAEALLGMDGEDHSSVALPWLSEREARLRLLAVRLLSRSLPSPQITQALSRALGDPDIEIRVRAAAALGASSDTGAVLSLLGHIDDGNLRMQLAVIDALAELRDANALVALVGKIQDGRAQVRQAIARALRVYDDEHATRALILLLRDSDDSVRSSAVSALGRASRENAVDSIVHVLHNDSSLDVRIDAVRALSRIRSERAAEVLIAALDDPRNELVVEAKQALSRMGTSAAAALLGCLAGQPSRVRAESCVFALGRTRVESAASAIGDAWRRRVVGADVALEALTALGDPKALPIVLESLLDEDPWVRLRAYQALFVLLDPDQPDGRAVEPLLAAAKQARDRPEELLLLVSLLGRTGSERVAPELVTYARSSRLRLKLAATRALGWVASTQSNDVLLEALDSPEPRLRREAALGLRRIGSASAAGPLLERLEGASREDAHWIAMALVGPAGERRDAAFVEELTRRFHTSSGPQRDALLEAIAVAPAGGEALARMIPSAGLRTRAKLAELLSQHPAQSAALLDLARHPGPPRQNAAWSLGLAGGKGALPMLAELMKDHDPRVAANAAVSYGRLLQESGSRQAEPLCSLLDHRLAALRTSALVGLRLSRLGCSGRERAPLLEDPSAYVRLAAAELLAAERDQPEVAALLTRCADEERDARVASACESDAPGPPQPNPRPLTVFVQGATDVEPRPGLSYALRFADGTVRHGLADRRGAVSEPRPPTGEVSLEVPLLDDDP